MTPGASPANPPAACRIVVAATPAGKLAITDRLASPA